MNTRIIVGLICLATLGHHLCPVFGQGTVFTYQGRLSDTNGPVSGTNDFQFALYDAASNGSLIGSAVNVNDAAVANGLFTVPMDFGAAAFNGSSRWLEISVRV